MKRILLPTILYFIVAVVANAQSFGIGFKAGGGDRDEFRIGNGYSQHVESMQRDFFIRFIKNDGKEATQLHLIFQSDSIAFTNTNSFMNANGTTLYKYNVDARLSHEAIKFGMVKQYEWNIGKSRFRYGFNYGFFWEFTTSMVRQSEYDHTNYTLDDEIRASRLSFVTGAEIHYRCFTLGYKFERPFKDLIDHGYINSLQLSADNSSELRGLRLDQGLSYMFIGLCFDF